MNSLNKLVAISIPLLFSCYISAAPVIESVTGNLQDGQTMNLTGQNFSSANAKQLLWDTVENQKEEIVHNTAVTTSSTDSWANNGSAWTTPVVFDTANPRNGRFATYAGKTKSFLEWPRAVEDKGLKNLYVTWWFWVSESPSANGGSNKFIRVWDEADGNHTRVSWTQMHMTATAEDIGYNTEAIPSWGGWGGSEGKWNRLELWVSGDNNTVKAWTNNKLIHNITDFKKSTTSQGLNVLLMGFDPNVASDYPNLKFRFGDVYISPSIARVEISDKATWDDQAAIKEIQPINSWSNSRVDITLNFGSFTTLADKYLYIIDSKGEANQNGFPLLCPSCPLPPALE